jgi:hypothetical protein
MASGAGALYPRELCSLNWLYSFLTLTDYIITLLEDDSGDRPENNANHFRSTGNWSILGWLLFREKL